MSYTAINSWTAKEMFQLRKARAACNAFDLEKYREYMTQELQDKLERLGDPFVVKTYTTLKPLEQPEEKAVEPKEPVKRRGFHPKER